MILAAEPPHRCPSCNTTERSCQGKRSYQGLACCQACRHGAGLSPEAELIRLASTAEGITAGQAAGAIHKTDTPTPAETAKTRRRLERLADAERVQRIDDPAETPRRRYRGVAEGEGAQTYAGAWLPGKPKRSA